MLHPSIRTCGRQRSRNLRVFMGERMSVAHVLPIYRPTTRKTAIGSALRLLRGQIPNPSPEEALWLAVIEHAVRDAYSSRASSDKAREEARRWLESEYFDGVAVAIGLHPGWARNKIRQIPNIAPFN